MSAAWMETSAVAGACVAFFKGCSGCSGCVSFRLAHILSGLLMPGHVGGLHDASGILGHRGHHEWVAAGRYSMSVRSEWGTEKGRQTNKQIVDL